MGPQTPLKRCPVQAQLHRLYLNPFTMNRFLMDFVHQTSVFFFGPSCPSRPTLTEALPPLTWRGQSMGLLLWYVFVCVKICLCLAHVTPNTQPACISSKGRSPFATTTYWYHLFLHWWDVRERHRQIAIMANSGSYTLYNFFCVLFDLLNRDHVQEY